MPGDLISAIEQLSQRCGSPHLKDKLQQLLPIFQNAVSHPYGVDPLEEVLVCYTVGTLKFTHFDEGHGKGPVPYGLLDMDLFNVDGEENGHYQVVWKPETFDGLDKIPAHLYDGPFDKVVKEIPKFEMRANSNAAYTFKGRGGTPTGKIFATGPANLLLTPLKGGGQMFQISVATFVTGGTGDFHGARGTNTALGSSFVPVGVDLEKVPEGFPIPGVTVSTFRFVPKKNQG